MTAVSEMSVGLPMLLFRATELYPDLALFGVRLLPPASHAEVTVTDSPVPQITTVTVAQLLSI